MTDDRTVYTNEELLESGAPAQPLVANGIRCHGGFDADGRYVSPRTVHRLPAVHAWKQQLRDQGHGLIEIQRASLPPQYPNVAQSVLLLRHGVREPMVRALTIISIVEGFGAVIRDVEVPELETLVVEPIGGTGLAHLRGGLFEAHARDESGYRDEGGHKQMWEAARDLALENPKIPNDVLMRMMGRRGRSARPEPLFPQLDPTLHRMLQMMAQVMVIEVFAEGTFEWGKAVLSNPEVSAQPSEAGAMVGYIQADESPHVEYLRTVLSEVRARTLRTVDGGQIAGRAVVDGFMHAILSAMADTRPREQREDVEASMTEAFAEAADPDSLREEFESLASSWSPPSETGFEPRAA
jgi:hypothetical protein